MSRHEYEGINKQDEEEYEYDDSDLDDMLEDEYLTGPRSDVSTPQDIVTARTRVRRRKRCLAFGVFLLVGATFVAIASHFRQTRSAVKLNPENSQGAEDSIGKYGASSEEHVLDPQGAPGTPPSEEANPQQGSYEEGDNEIYAEDIVSEEDMYDDFEHENDAYDSIENDADDYSGFEGEGDDFDEFLEDEEDEYEIFESEQAIEDVEPNEYEDAFDYDDEFDPEQADGWDTEGNGLDPEGEEYYDDIFDETEGSEYYDDTIDQVEESESYPDAFDEFEEGEFYDDEISEGIETDYTFDEAYDEGASPTIPPLLENTLASVYRQGSDTDTAMYWITTTTVAEDIFGECLRLTQASALEEPSMDQELRVTEVEGSGYVNVDLFTLEGIDHAKAMRLAETGLADVVVVPFFYPGSSLFDPGHRAQCFTILRDPIEEVVRSFVDSLEDMDVEDADLMTIEDYANSDDAIDNYMTRSLSNNWDRELNDEDLTLAKSIIERKCLVGLADELTTSIARFEAYFGWTQRSDDSLECQEALLEEEKEMEAEYPYVEKGSQTWHILAEKNLMDVQLYDHARQIFDQQNKFFVNEGD